MGRAGVGGRGGTPLSPSERRDAYGKDTASTGPLAPLAGFKGLRPTAGQGPSKGEGVVVVGTFWVPCWPTVGAVLATLGLSLGSVGPS